MTYSRVAGDFPPGVHLDSASGVITGIIPDADATYSFTIRATDGHGKYADNIFRIVVRGNNAKPNNNLCHDVSYPVHCFAIIVKLLISLTRCVRSYS